MSRIVLFLIALTIFVRNEIMEDWGQRWLWLK